jgi:Ca-activated chloride channel family protein
MFRFAHSEYLNALMLIPIFLLLFLSSRWWRNKKIQQYGDKQLVKKLIPDISNFKSWLRFIVFCFAYGLLVIGIADPQIGSKTEVVKREGVDIIIALDVSNSMKAEDIKPDRLERSKQSISRLIDKLQNDRIGIIVFAGKAYVQLPLTSDFGAAKLFLSTIDSDMIPTQGTAIGAAIRLATQSMDTKDTKHKVLIIITDGENHEDDALAEAKKSSETGIIIHTIGMGSPEGAPIPVYNSNKVKTGFLKDQNGSPVVTKLDASMLELIAAAGKGKFVRASNSRDGLEVLLEEINKMEKKNFGTKIFTDYEDRFQYFLVACFLLLVVELFISERKSKWWQRLNLLGTEERQNQ